MAEALQLHAEGSISVCWAPFEHVAADPRIVVLGITPGRQQAENALAAFNRALTSGEPLAVALQRAKLTGAFSGPMREKLVAMLDHVGAQRALGVATCAELFDPSRELAHLTSALRYPVFTAGANYNGAPDMLRTPVLRRMVETHLSEEIRALPNALWLPLGSKPAAALRHLAAANLIDRSRILEGLPHPSGANGERIAYFLGRKARGALSAKTQPAVIDAARKHLIEQLARFRNVA
ncbi:hypothetical protein JMJ56_30410 [Belnapia sp. T18]|uniref:Uracil DNA glycosylase superfamily protein n=1 Tax=Belnapia arida TaxID=2804533 RepID=A0ABS1UC79_9PROT|nr:hypothetical protein [Belnapia arida]MBL6082292.1 hypothetical protein [Belnapia arida]